MESNGLLRLGLNEDNESLTDDCAFVLSRLFEEYSYLKDEKIRNNIPDFIKRITSSNATCSTGEVDSGYVRQEIRGDLQKGFSFTDTRSYEEKAELNAKFKDLYEKYKKRERLMYLSHLRKTCRPQTKTSLIMG